jgi:hypothetical protein
MASTISRFEHHRNSLSLLENRVRNRIPHPTSQKHFEDVLQEEWYEIPPETVHNLYESFPRRVTSVLKAKGGPAPYQ